MRLSLEGITPHGTRRHVPSHRESRRGDDSASDPCHFTVKLAAVALVPPGVVTAMGPLVAPPGTVAQT